MTTPHLEYSQLWPVILVLGAACVGILVEAFVPRVRRLGTQIALTGATLVVALAGTVTVAARGHLGVDAEGAVAMDGPTLYLQGLILVVAVGGVLLFAERRLESGVTAFAGQAAALPGTSAEREASARGLEHSEVYPLLLFAVGGMLLFPAANDLLLLFVALEVLSLPLYLLCALARRRRLLSQEAALKYFLLGAFSSAFLLYGIALVYGYAGSMRFSDIARAHGDHNLLLIGLGMISVGLMFKVGAAPFHAWTPDVYQGAPTPVTAFMSAATKVAAFGAMIRLFAVAFHASDLKPMLWLVAIVTMVVGTVVAVVQNDVKRMLAYSSISHTGFLLTGVIGVVGVAAGAGEGTRAVLLYLTAYAAAIVGSFALVGLVRDPAGEITAFRGWEGLGRRAPLFAGLFTLFLLSMAGIPLTAGFLGKWAVFAAALDAGAWPVVVVAILTSIVAVFFYVRFIRLLYFTDPGESSAVVATPSLLTQGVIAACAVVTVVVGVIPGPVLNLIGDAGSFLR